MKPVPCSDCGTPLSPRETGTLCPKCLMKMGLDTPSSGVPEASGSGQREYGPYRILRLLGKGGMGSVYEAEERASGLRIALKVFGQTLDTHELRGRFLREGRLAASVRHPNVVGVISAGEVEGTPVIAMELLHDGTLGERVKKHGPMAPKEAVEAILQVIDGLEAAHATGVLHRDVKPANCFMSADGVVKVGDFGLSMSTLARTENSLTVSGAVLGTPAFAAPEQLRGEEIDVRADIYAIGATLYYLLTGKSTHTADTLVAMIAAVLTKSPPSPQAVDGKIPAALSRVVMRCLERNRAQRYPDYASLRSALERFRPEAPSPGTLGLRVVAGAVDTLLSTAPLQLTIALSGLGYWPTTPGLHSLAVWTAGVVFAFLYFAAMEGRWGTTPGKLLCGLRVARVSGGYPGYGRAFFRSAIFQSNVILSSLILFAWMRQSPVDPDSLLEDAIRAALFGVLCIGMRRKNGFAMLQDLMSGTRVVALPSPENDIAIRPRNFTPPPDEADEKIGPFVVCRRQGSFVEAWDEALRRHVWIVEREKGFPALTPRRRSLNRPGRLQWLQGIRSWDQNWDAFEAPAGQPLAAFADRKQPWTRVRRWLMDLASEFTDSARDGTRLESVSLDRVWVTSRGHAVWLDFPLPEPAPVDHYRVADARELQGFLAWLAEVTLAPGPPIHAARLVDTLAHRKLESAEMVAGNLRATMGYTATLTRRKRLLTLVLWPLLALAFSFIGMFSIENSPEMQSERKAAMVQIQFKKQETSVVPGDVGKGPVTEGQMDEMAESMADAALESRPVLLGLNFMLALALGAVFSGAWTIFTGVPPGLHLYGLVLVNRSGQFASRWVAMARSALTGLVTLVLAGATTCVMAASELGDATMLVPAIYALGVVGFIGVHSFLSPRRAVVDWMLGTTIVPR